MKIFILTCLSLLVFAVISDVKAQTFRTFTTTTQEITYTEREVKKADGTTETVVETVIETVVVDLTPNPVTAVSAVETDKKEETLFLTPAAVVELKAAIKEEEEAAESSGTTASATLIDEVIAEEVEVADKFVDEDTGTTASEITYVEIVDGAEVETTVNDDVVEENDVVTTERTEFTTIVVEEKAIVSGN